MVCLGNICRSPIAEGLLSSKVATNALNWTVDSAGTSGFHNGDGPDRRSIAECAQHGLDISNQISREFLIEDFDRFDLILVMDASNYQALRQKARNKQDIDKIKLILNFVYPNENRAVPDPYYNNGFDHVYRLLDQATDQIIAEYIGT